MKALEIKMDLKDELEFLCITAKTVEKIVYMLKKFIRNDINYNNDFKGCFEILVNYLNEMITRTDDLLNLK